MQRPPDEAVFDIGKERNKGNQFWKQGKGREEHRAKENEAKLRRQIQKGAKTAGISKHQILEESHSDEVSPGVTRTVSPTMTVKSAEATQAQTKTTDGSAKVSKPVICHSQSETISEELVETLDEA